MASERAPYVRKRPGVGVQTDRPGEQNATGATCVAHTEGGGGWHTHAGHAISKPAVDRTYRVVALRCPVRYASRPLYSQGGCRRARPKAIYRRETVSLATAQFRRRYAICADVISRRRRRNTITPGGALKYEKCDSTALIRRQKVVSIVAL